MQPAKYTVRRDGSVARVDLAGLDNEPDVVGRHGVVLLVVKGGCLALPSGRRQSRITLPGNRWQIPYVSVQIANHRRKPSFWPGSACGVRRGIFLWRFA